MKASIINQPWGRVISVLLSGLLVASAGIWVQNAQAHSSAHVGSEVVQINKVAALEATLPSPAKAVKKIEVLDQEATAWADETYGVRLSEGLYSYFLAQDEQSNEIIGGAMVQRSRFQRGRLSLAVGVDANQHITNVVLVSTNKNYLAELKTNVGEEVISFYRGMSVKEIANAKALRFASKTAREFAVAVRNAAVLLATLMNSEQQVTTNAEGS